jgi:hypothetical protein
MNYISSRDFDLLTGNERSATLNLFTALLINITVARWDSDNAPTITNYINWPILAVPKNV